MSTIPNTRCLTLSVASDLQRRNSSRTGYSWTRFLVRPHPVGMEISLHTRAKVR